MEPLVSVILPVQNAEPNLPACLDSLLKQKHENLEIIAIDDNSKDESTRILKQYRKIDKRIKPSFNVKRYGIAVTLNRALKKAKGDFITFMNPHDVNSVWRIKKQIEFLKKNPKVVAVGTQAVNIDEKGKHLEKTTLPHEHEQIYKSFLPGLPVYFETLMINKRLIPRDLLYFAQNKYPFVYKETFLKLFQYGKFANLMQHLYYHRGKPVGSANLSKKEKLTHSLSLAVKSFTVYDYKPSLRSFLSPFNKISVN